MFFIFTNPFEQSIKGDGDGECVGAGVLPLSFLLSFLLLSFLLSFLLLSFLLSFLLLLFLLLLLSVDEILRDGGLLSDFLELFLEFLLSSISISVLSPVFVTAGVFSKAKPL